LTTESCLRIGLDTTCYIAGGATSVVVHDLYGKEVAAKVEGGKVTLNLTGSPLNISLGKGAAK